MASVVTFINNPRERQVLRIILESYGYNVVQLEPTPQSCIQVTQCNPRAIIVEIPEEFEKHVSIIGQIKTNPQTKNVKILAYGNTPSDDRTAYFAFKKVGIDRYSERSLTTEIIRSVIQPQKDDNVTLHVKQQKIYEGELEDSTKILDPNTSTIERINIMVKRIGELLAFPFTIAKVLSVTQSDRTGAQDLARAIEIDPVVVSTVLKVANSAFYSAGNRSAGTMGVKDAIVRIGFTETKNIALSLSVMKLFTDEEKSVGFSREDFWFHSLSTAVIAGKIARQANYELPEVAFLCGLLHDFGVILLDEFFPAYLQASLQQTTQSGGSFLKVQKKKWGMTHNDVVVKLFEEWNLPESVITAIRNFMRYETYEDGANGSDVMLVQIVGVSNILAKSLALGRECDEYVSEIPNEILENLKFPRNINDSFFVKVYEDLTMFNSFLNLKRDAITFERIPEPSNQLHKIAYIDQSDLVINPFEFYLFSQGNLIIYPDSVKSISEQEDSPTCIVIYADKEATLDDFSDYQGIQKRSSKSEDEETDANNNTIPVLIISDTIKESPTPSQVVLPSSVDLRVFSFAIESLNLGHVFELQTEKTVVIEPAQEAPVQESSEPVRKKIKRDFSFTNRVVDSFLVVMELHGHITVETFKSLMNIMIALLKKNRYLAIDFSTSVSISDDFLLLLENFRKALRAKKGVLCPFAMRKLPNSSDTVKQTLFTFNSDKELVQYVKLCAEKMKEDQ